MSGSNGERYYLGNLDVGGFRFPDEREVGYDAGKVAYFGIFNKGAIVGDDRLEVKIVRGSAEIVGGEVRARGYLLVKPVVQISDENGVDLLEALDLPEGKNHFSGRRAGIMVHHGDLFSTPVSHQSCDGRRAL
jgi:hypothetical protein